MTRNPFAARLVASALGFLMGALLLLQPAAFAQSQFATLSGTVTDGSGAVIRGAKVTVTNALSGEPRATDSNGDGFFAVPSLPAGTYEVTVELAGFQKWVGKGITLNGGDSRKLAIAMKVGAVTVSVVVESTTSDIATTDSGEKAGLISSKELEDLALVSRNASEFVKFLPGALLAPTNGLNRSNYSGQVIGINGFVPNGQSAGGLGAVQINGQSANITQDGQNVFDPGAAGNATPVNPNPAMISEVKASTSNFSSEYAQGPVVVNTVTRSGGNEFHGEGRFNIRNSALNATEKFNKEQKICSAGTCNYPQGFNPKPDSSYYYPGFNFGGPIIIPKTGINKSRSKLFFFESYENYHQTPDAGVERAFVPDAKMLSGDFSELAAFGGSVGRVGMGSLPTTPYIYQGPLPPKADGSSPYPAPCPAPNATGGLNIPIGQSCWAGYNTRMNSGCTINGGVLSSQCIDPNALLLMNAFMPTPNIPMSQIGTTNGFNYIQSFNAPQNSWQNLVKLDWVISENTKAYVSWSRQRESATMPFGLWNSASDWSVPSPSPVVGNNGSDFLVATFLHVFSPTMTSEAHFGYTKVIFPTTPTNPSKLLRKDAGFPLSGVFNNPEMPALLTWGQSIPNFGDIGHDYHPTMIANKGIPSAAENLTKVFGTHTTKYGFFFQHIYNTQDNWGQYMGVLTYSPWTTPTNNNYADVLMGIGESYFEQALPPPASIANNISAFYAQDSWKITRRLTLEYGMRFEHYGKPYAPVDNVGMAVFDPRTYNANITAAANTQNNGVSWHKLNSAIPLSGANSRLFFYSPRVGLAFDLLGNGRTVLRGGWGKYRAYDSLQSNNYTGPSNTAFGSVGVNCNQTDPACATWETIDSLARPAPTTFGTTMLSPGLNSINTYNPRNDEQPLVTSYSFSIDQQLPWKLQSEFSYVGNQGKFFQNAINIDAVPLGALLTNSNACSITDTGCQVSYRPYQDYTAITSSETAGKSRYDAFQASVKRNYSWLMLQGSYTWSKTLAANQASGNSYFTGALPNFGTDWLYGVDKSDRPQAFSLLYVFYLPKVRGANAFVRGMTNGWELSGTSIIQSGMPVLNATNGQNRNFNLSQAAPDGSSQDNVHLLGTPDVTVFPVLTCNPTSGLGHNQFANPNCFGPQPKGKLGGAGMPYIGGPMFWNNDLSVRKQFRIKEHQSLQFSASAFNLTNTGLLSFSPGDSNLNLTFNDLGQVITNAKMLYPGNGLPPGSTGATTDQIMSCQQATVGQTINGVKYPNGIKCAGATTFGMATHHVGSRIMEFGLKYTF